MMHAKCLVAVVVICCGLVARAQEPAVLASVEFEVDGKPVRVVVTTAEATCEIAGKAIDPSRLKVGGSLPQLSRTVVTQPRPRATLGITVEEVPEAVADQIGIKPSAALLITGVEAGGPAATSGLKRHDVIVRVGDHEEVTREVLRTELENRAPGDLLPIQYISVGERKLVLTSLGQTDESCHFVTLDAQLQDVGLEWRELSSRRAVVPLATCYALQSQGYLMRQSGEDGVYDWVLYSNLNDQKAVKPDSVQDSETDMDEVDGDVLNRLRRIEEQITELTALLLERK